MLIASLRKTECQTCAPALPLYWQRLAAIGGQSKELGNSIADSSAREVSKLLARMRLSQPGLRDMFLGAKLPLSFKEVQSS